MSSSSVPFDPTSQVVLSTVPVIQWEDAMQQVGDDEEFLRELLNDLRNETDTQLATIAAIIQSPQDAPYHRIMRAAHVIKGAAANLMCGQLRQASYNLEQAASRAHDAAANSPNHTIAPPEYNTAVQTCYNDMQQARQQLLVYLQSIGV